MQPTRTAPVIVGVDGSEESKPALRWAVEYAQMSGAPLHALMAWDLPALLLGIDFGALLRDDFDFEQQAETTITAMVAAVVGDSVTVTHRVERGHPAAVLVAASEQARLLVVGSHGHGGFAASLLGSVSQQCILHAHCPVVVVRGETDD